MCYVVVSRPHV